jgi:hypothetical protein
MDNAVKVGIAVASGYVLGRRHKLRYAIGVGAWLMGRRVPLSPRAIASKGIEAARENPDVMDFVDELRETGWIIGRRAAGTWLDDRAKGLSAKLRDRESGRGHADAETEREGEGQTGRTGGEDREPERDRGSEQQSAPESGGGKRDQDEESGTERESAAGRRPAATRA